ncbi:phytoene/squalene synthase family protein [Profundibacter sp.]
MSIKTCAEMLRKSDPDRFLATMTAPPDVRAKLFPLYAFNLEVAHLPWVSTEPMIAEMRLQWWQDSIAAVFRGDTPDPHEVLTPLAGVIRAHDLQQQEFHDLIEARRRDTYAQPFTETPQLWQYLQDTSGNLMAIAARMLGVGDDRIKAAQDYGTAAGLANYLLAVSELKARGRMPLPDDSEDAVQSMAREALTMLDQNRTNPALKPALPALLTACQARPTLRIAAKYPAKVGQGQLQRSDFRRKGRLLVNSMLGRW